MNSPPILTSDSAETARRRLTLLDLVVVIAAIGLGLTVPRAFNSVTSVGDQISNLTLSLGWQRVFASAWLLIATVTVALLVILSPRSCGPERLRRPGALAMFLVVLAWCLCEVECTAGQVSYLFQHGEWTFHVGWSLFFGPVTHFEQPASYVILACWINNRFMGQRPRSTGWLDRLGCLLGWVWIVWGVSDQAISPWLPW